MAVHKNSVAMYLEHVKQSHVYEKGADDGK